VSPVWVIPHQTNQKAPKEFEGFLIKRSITFIKTSTRDPAFKDSKVILVDEIGILSELYEIAQVAMVGGGFGAGIHNTIEPAVWGVPIITGPKKSDQFDEIDELKAQGQIRIVNHSDEFWAAFNEFKNQTLEHRMRLRNLYKSKQKQLDSLMKWVRMENL
jgi:3-deoxy-D-manno-octulosonic-acid transferase